MSDKKLIPACCDVFHEEGAVLLKMEMPGVKKEDLNISVDNDLLIIGGKKASHAVHGEFRLKEIQSGDYYNEFTIDNTIDREKIEAAVKNGVVTIHLKIKESEKPRTIKVVSK